MENGAAAVKSVAVPQKLKIELTQDPAVPFLYLPKRTQSAFSKAAIFIPVLTAPIICTATAGAAIQRAINKRRGKSNAGTHVQRNIILP